jgi:hypothetical protein
MNLARCARFAEWPPGDRFSRPGGIHKLAGRKGPGTGKMSRMEMEQESRCVRDAASRSTPLIRMSSTGSRDVGSRTMGGVQIGDAGLGESFHPGGFSGVDYRLDQERPDLD